MARFSKPPRPPLPPLQPLLLLLVVLLVFPWDDWRGKDKCGGRGLSRDASASSPWSSRDGSSLLFAAAQLLGRVQQMEKEEAKVLRGQPPQQQQPQHQQQQQPLHQASSWASPDAAAFVSPACGADAMRTHELPPSADFSTPATVYGSCDLCDMSPTDVAAMLALPHNCQKDVWADGKWMPVDGQLWYGEKEDVPVCVVICPKRVPCLPLAAQLPLQRPAAATPAGFNSTAHPCLLSLWVRGGTSDVKVMAQIYFDFFHSSMKSLDLPTPQELPVRTMLDAGANVGMVTVYFATLYPGVKVVDLEPSSANFEVLVRNTKRFRNVFLLQRALWSHKASLCLFQPGKKRGGEWSFQVKEKSMVPKKMEIINIMDSVSIPDVLRMFSLSSFDLMKIDVEGSEGAVFANTSDVSFLEHGHIVVLELHDNMWEGATNITTRAFQKFPRWHLATARGEHVLWLATSGK